MHESTKIRARQVGKKVHSTELARQKTVESHRRSRETPQFDTLILCYMACPALSRACLPSWGPLDLRVEPMSPEEGGEREFVSGMPTPGLYCLHFSQGLWGCEGLALRTTDHQNQPTMRQALASRLQQLPITLPDRTANKSRGPSRLASPGCVSQHPCSLQGLQLRLSRTCCVKLSAKRCAPAQSDAARSLGAASLCAKLRSQAEGLAVLVSV